MANSTLKGFRPYSLGGAAVNSGATKKYFGASGYATGIGIGALVSIVDSEAGATTSDAKMGRPLVQNTAVNVSTNIVAGVVVGVDPILGVDPASRNFSRKYRPASTGMYLDICDDPDQVFEIAGDDVSDGSGAWANLIGCNATFVAGSLNTTTGVQESLLDTASADTTAALPLKIVGVVLASDNNLSDAPIHYLVKINLHNLGNGTVGVAD